MYLQAWTKYLPVILILVKRSAVAPQMLAMDMGDFIKSSGGKKNKLGFAAFSLGNGQIYINNGYPETARELATLLTGSTGVKNALSTRKLSFTMTNHCVLSISDISNTASQVELANT